MINGEDIHQLLSKGVQFPQAMADDILARSSITGTVQNVKSTPHDYAALLAELARRKRSRRSSA